MHGQPKKSPHLRVAFPGSLEAHPKHVSESRVQANCTDQKGRFSFRKKISGLKFRNFSVPFFSVKAKSYVFSPKFAMLVVDEKARVMAHEANEMEIGEQMVW